MTQNEFMHNSRAYQAAPPPFSTSINKCTGCEFHATKYGHGCGHLPTCLGTLRDDFRDIIWIQKEQ